MRQIRLIIAALFVFGPFAANADLIGYEVDFVPSSGPDGVIEFLWDTDTELISSFLWDFGGLTGGAALDWSSIVFGDTISAFVFEILTGQDVFAGIDCSTNCAQSFSEDLIGNAFGDIYFLQIGFGPNYFVRPTAGGGTGRGTWVVSVPEPGSLALLGIGLLGMGLARRRRML